MSCFFSSILSTLSFFLFFFKNLKLLFSTVLHFFTNNVAQFLKLHFFKVLLLYFSHFNFFHLFIYFFILGFFNKLYCAEIVIVDVEIVTVYPNGEITIHDVNTHKTTYSTLWAEMNNQIEDGNSTHDYSSESDTSSQNNDTVFADALLKDYHDTVLQQCNTREDIVEKSLLYVKAIIPNELFASSPEELSNELSSINVYLDNIKKIATLETEMDTITLANYLTAVTTYNVACLHHITYESHKVIIENVYFATFNKIIAL